MSTNTEDPKKEMGRRLTLARERAGYPKRIDAIRKFKWNGNTYKSHEYGFREFSRDDAVIYSEKFGVSVSYLMLLDDEPYPEGVKLRQPPNDDALPTAHIQVHGESAGGVWREGDDRPIDDQAVLVPANPSYPSYAQYARRVIGTSVSNRIGDGEYAIMMRYDAAPSNLLQPGRLVDVQRVRAGLREHTIKVYAGEGRLVTDSRDLDEQEELTLRHDDEDTIVEIVGIVIGSYRQQI